ncbi:hypothetical protein V6N13_146647 [Hibiscus sabdariffa]
MPVVYCCLSSYQALEDEFTLVSAPSWCQPVPFSPSSSYVSEVMKSNITCKLYETTFIREMVKRGTNLHGKQGKLKRMQTDMEPMYPI